jgi:hypothetical protein
MMTSGEIALSRASTKSPHEVQGELDQAREALLAAEAELAEEQAAVNAFRMHCRLKLDFLVDVLLDLQAQEQGLLTRIALLRQDEPPGDGIESGEPLWEDAERTREETLDLIDLPLPSQTARDRAAEKRLYRELARKFHPDLAESAVERAYRTSMMAAVNNAYAAEDVQALYDLAGELEPAELVELAGYESVSIRQLREQIMRMNQLRRKARRQLETLRQEKTARLWYRARQMPGSEGDSWNSLRAELERIIEWRQDQLAALQEQWRRLERGVQ